MNRADRRAARAARAAGGQELGHDEINALLASITETLRASLPGCEVTLIVSRGDAARADVKHASSMERRQCGALMRALAERLDGSSV